VTVRVYLLGVLSAVMVVILSVMGDWPEIVELDFGFSSRESSFYIDPIFLFYSSTCPGSGASFGNVIMLDSSLSPGGQCEGDWTYALRHELNHVRQCYALGWWMWPLSLLLPIEPQENYTWSDPGEPDRTMWLPPLDWPHVWHFIEVR
jgi:hypothetical protein